MKHFLSFRKWWKFKFIFNRVNNFSIEIKFLIRIEVLIIAKTRVTVELNWTRARASNPRVGQGWTHLICSKELVGFEFLFDGLNRTSTFDRANWSNSDSCSTNWIEQIYLFVERSIRISTHTKSSSWKINPRIDHQILLDELNWTNNSVRRIELNKQFCLSPSSGLARVPWS